MMEDAVCCGTACGGGCRVKAELLFDLWWKSGIRVATQDETDQSYTELP